MRKGKRKSGGEGEESERNVIRKYNELEFAAKAAGWHVQVLLDYWKGREEKRYEKPVRCRYRYLKMLVVGRVK